MRKSKIMASVLALALAVTSLSVPSGAADAAKKPKLNKSKTSVEVGGTIKLKVKNGSKKAKVTWKSSKKSVAKVKKVKKAKTAQAIVTGVAEGSAKITATYKLKGKKTKLKCNVTVGSANKGAEATAAPGTGTQPPSAAPTQPGTDADNTKAPDNDKETPTSTPTKKPTERPTKAPTPTPTPFMVNPYIADLSTLEITVDGMPGTEDTTAAYNPETGCIESTMLGLSGFIVRSPITEKKEEYKYVEITYTLMSGGDVNIYAGKYDAEPGQDGTGWSSEIKLNNYTMDEEFTLLLSAKDWLENEPLGAIKIFNFGQDTTISISDITFYMDGDVSKPEDYVAHTLSEGAEVTIDGLASEGEEWADARAYKFVSKISQTSDINKTDTTATAQFMHDADNAYIFINVKDSSIDNTAADNFNQDGLEILFDEDNCKKSGSDSQDWSANVDGFHYRFTGLDKDSAEKSGLSAACDAMQGGGSEGKARQGIEIKYALTDKGYSIEAKIPFASPKAVGDVVSLDLIVQDCSGGTRYNEIYMYPAREAKSYWNNGSAEFGTLILGQAGEAQPEPEQPGENQDASEA